MRSLALQTDGKILVGGRFTTLGGEVINFARLNYDGTLDLGYNSRAEGADPSYPFYAVNCLAVQTDGKILVGGEFTKLGGQPRNNIGRLNADGTVDTEFNPGSVPTPVLSLVVQNDGKILAGRAYGISRLNADGTLDSGFYLEVGGVNYPWVSAIAIQADGRILVGGKFTMLGGQPRNHIARLNADGTLDPGFNPGANSLIGSLALQADGKILVGGSFTTLGGQPCNYIGRLNADGIEDTEFNPGADNGVSALTLQADGKILVGGSFTTTTVSPQPEFTSTSTG